MAHWVLGRFVMHLLQGSLFSLLFEGGGSLFTRTQVETSKRRGHNKAAIFSHFPPGLNLSQKIRGKTFPIIRPLSRTPLISPTDILVPTAVSPHTLFVVAWSQNPGVIFQSILAEEFSAGILFTCIFGQSQSFGSQKLTELKHLELLPYLCVKSVWIQTLHSVSVAFGDPFFAYFFL